MSNLPSTLFRLTALEPFGSLLFLPDLGGSVFYASSIIQGMTGSVGCLGARLDDGMSRDVDSLTIPELGRRFAQDILRADLPRPLHLAGFSFAGLVAFETARHLEALGAAADHLWLLDAEVMRKLPKRWARFTPKAELRYALGYARQNWRSLLGLGVDPSVLHAYCEIRIDLSEHPTGYREIIRALYGAMTSYRPKPWPGGRAVLIRAAISHNPGGAPDDLGWRRLIPHLETRVASGDHLSMLRDAPSAAQVVGFLKEGMPAKQRESAL